MSEKVKLILFNVGLAVTMIGTLYWCSERSALKIKERIDTVNRNYKYSKGIITDLHSYKGHSVEIKYRIKDTLYEFSGGWDKNPKSLSDGDSVRFKYSLENPKLIISELEDEY